MLEPYLKGMWPAGLCVLGLVRIEMPIRDPLYSKLCSLRIVMVSRCICSMESVGPKDTECGAGVALKVSKRDWLYVGTVMDSAESIERYFVMVICPVSYDYPYLGAISRSRMSARWHAE